MNSTELALTLAALELKPLAAAESTLEARLRATMQAAPKCWTLTTEDEQFKAAVGAVLLVSEPEDTERLTVEMRLLGGLSALMNGLPVDMGALMPDDFEPVGLLALWSAVRSATTPGGKP